MVRLRAPAPPVEQQPNILFCSVNSNAIAAELEPGFRRELMSGAQSNISGHENVRSTFRPPLAMMSSL